MNKAIFAAGCFWGVQHYFNRFKGVTSTRVGYAGGSVDNPTYEEVCGKKTGHLEAIEVTFNPEEVSYEELVKYFFEIHDFSQSNGQGPDLGPQYLSAIFALDEEQEATAHNVIELLKSMGHSVATKIHPGAPFWEAEGYHQNYYSKTGHEPYCHFWRKIF